MIRFASILSIAFALTACSESFTPEDASISFDAALPDAGRDGTVNTDMHVAVCGDGQLDPGESCDDGNTTETDTCDNTCRRTAFCGNDMREGTEICDDGNNFSSDGCSADCASNETCGNGIRDIAVGELCDTTPGCASDCHSVTTCGNGTIDSGESCDDSNATAWDGCGADCLTEQSLILNSLMIGGSSVGCDYSGDGVPDNRFADALNGAESLLNMQLSDQLDGGQFILLMSLMGLDDQTGSVDDSVRVAWFQGDDADTDASNNFSGSADVFGQMSGFAEDGSPLTSFGGAISVHHLAGGPEDISLPLGLPIPIQLRQAHIAGTLGATGGHVDGLSDGLLCGAVSVRSLALLPNFLSMFGMMMPPCDATVSSSNMADVIIGGARSLITIGPAQPDVDVDGDGLEYYETITSGVANCQPVVSACIDGDGTRIPGHDCSGDSRMVDGFSVGLPFTAVNVNVTGLH